MKPNVGGIDRTGRIVVGVILVAVAIFAPIDMAWRVAAAVVAAIALVTASVRYCPANAMLGIDTAKHDDSKKD